MGTEIADRAVLGLVLVVRASRRYWLADGARRLLDALPSTLGFFKRQGRQVDKLVSMYAVISRARPSLPSTHGSKAEVTGSIREREAPRRR